MSAKLRLLFLLAVFTVTLQSQAADRPPFTKVLPPLPANQEMLILEINLEPGQTSSPHRHNAHVFVYVLEGQIQMQVAGGELLTLSAGEMFYENPDNIHTVSRNASQTQSARFLVHMLKVQGAEVSVPVN